MIARRSPFHRLTALVLSHALAATSVWGGLPAARAAGPAPALGPILTLALAPAPGALGEVEPFRQDRAVEDVGWHDRSSQSGGGSPSGRGLHPVVECVTREGLFHWTARFGYRNDNPGPVDVAVGSRNFLAPGPAGQGQPTRFEPGRSPASAAFAVPFSGLVPVAWALRGPDGKTRVALATVLSERCSAPPPPPPPAPACQTVFFGPQRFERNGCGPDGYRARIDVPASVPGPYLLRVRNGAANGAQRVSSAWIKVDGDVVFGPSDFNPNIGALERVAPLAAGERSRLDVVLSGQPGSYLTVEACGAGGDATPPVISLVQPAPGAVIADPRPTLRVAYDDPGGAGQVAGSGVDPATLSVVVDGEDRSGLFTRQSNEASAAWPEELAFASGVHELELAISDRAGNRRQYQASFTVDVEPPTLARLEPAEFVADAQPVVRLSFADAQGLDGDSLRVLIDGQDRTSWFTVGDGVASGQPPAPLAAGAHVLSASIRDRAGNVASVDGAFVVDLQAPTLEIGQPRDGARLGTDLVELIVRFGDDQAVDPATFAATLDAVPATLSIGPDGAMGFAGPLADGPHRFEARLRDRAGREAVAGVSFSVDRTRPALEVFEPAPGLVTRDATPEVVIRYADAAGLDLSTFAVAIGGVPRTSAFSVGADEARAALDESTRLPEGVVEIDAEIADLAGNRASARASITVDTVAPRAALLAPSQAVASNAARPDIRLEFADPAPGTGLETTAVRIRIDGVDATSAFVVSGDAAIGRPEAALGEGQHVVEVTLRDRAGNEATEAFAFSLDLTAPVVERVAPDAPFVATADPEVEFRLADAGAGVEPGNVVVRLASPSLPERDVTADFAVECDAEACSVRGVVASGLADGSHRFTVQVADRAGNVAADGVTFEVDTVAPTLLVEAPALDAFLAGARPELRLRYADERSGVDLARVELRVDGIDRSALLTPGAELATGALAPEGEPLADGPHAFEVVVHDRAGNASETLTQSFVVDTVAPTVAAVAPAPGAWLGTRTPELRFTWADGGSGLDLPWTRLAIDGLAQAGPGPQADGLAFTSPSLADGAHEARVEVRDLAGNVAQASVAFRVDTAAPSVPELEAGDDGWYGEVDAEGRGRVRGRVTDLDPNVALECRVGGVVSSACSCSAVAADGAFECSVPLAEGDNDVEIRARDAAGNETRTERTLRLDTVAPTLEFRAPAAESVTTAAAVDVEVEVTDASAVTLSLAGLEGVAGGCTGAAPARCTFHVAGVPVGAGPFATLTATATDAAGHTGTGSIRLRVDRDPPQPAIAQPPAGAFARGAAVDVSGTVADASAVLVDVNGIPATVGGGGAFSGEVRTWTFQATVPVVDGASSIVVTAFDEAGLRGTAERALTVDSAPPALAITAPAPGLVTRATSLEISGTVADATAVTVTVDGTPAAVAGGVFAATVSLATEGPRTFVVQATDAAGNVSTRSVAVVVDRTPPALVIAAPDEGAPVLALPLVVSGTTGDATDVVVRVNGTAAVVDGAAWSASVSPAEGRQAIEVVAVDAAGNEARAVRSVLVDVAAPELAVSAPAPGLLTREPTVVATGTVRDASVVAVTVNGIAVAVSGAAGGGCASPCAFSAAVALPEGESTVLVVATDEAGRVAEFAVPVTRDSTPPVLALTTPETISRGRAGQAVASLADGVALESGRLEARISAECALGAVDGAGPSLVLALALPECARAGDAVAVMLSTIDRAGNAATLSRAVRVVADGAVAGQALDATTGLPLPSVQVSVDGTASAPDALAAVTDAAGRYAVPASDQRLVVRLARDGYTAVERVVEVASGQGTVAVDAFLTPRAAPVVVDAAGGAVHVHVPRAAAGDGSDAAHGTCTGADCAPSPVRLSLPAGTYTITGLSPQALPGLLPLGWSAVAAFELASPAPPSSVTVDGLTGAVHLVRYSSERHAWVMEQASIGTAVALPGAGTYAFVVADAVEPPLAVPAVGEELEGLAMVPLSEAAASEGSVTPPVIPPTGGTATGAIRVRGVAGVPSGTVVQASVVETYTLASGEQASSEPRTFDIVVARARSLLVPADPDPCTAPDGALCAEFPITPSRSYAPAELTEGRVRLDILAGREGVRGTVGGGSQAVTLAAGDVAISVAQGALVEDLALAVEQHALSSFLPSNAGLVPLAELSFDASGATLGTAAQVTVAAAIAAGDSAVLAKVERADGIPYLVVVAAFDVEAERVVSRSVPGLPGLREGGRYVVYRIAGPVAFVTGTTTAAGATVQARVTSEGLPFHAYTRADGHYAIAVIPGPRVLTATVPGTSLLGTASLHAPSEAPVPIALQGVVTAATVTPADGAVALAPTTSVTLESAAPIAAASVTAEAIRLVDDVTGAPVALRFVLSTSGRTLSAIPQQALAFATRYRLEAPGLRDTFGGLVQVPVTRFTTKADTPPQYDLAAIRFGYPGEDGLVQVTAAPGTLQPGTEVLIINAGNGAVVTFTAENDGSLGTTFPADLPATISDTLYVTVTDPLGNVTTFTRSEYVAADGTTGIGPGGGMVRGEGGVELRIPEGALKKGATFKLGLVDPSELPTLFPNAQHETLAESLGAHHGSVLRLEASEGTRLEKEADLVFPLSDFAAVAEAERPTKPEDAFYYIHRRVERCTDGSTTCTPENRIVVFEVIDEARAEGEGSNARVVTASPPFFAVAGLLAGTLLLYTMSWSYEPGRLGLPRPGLIRGKALRTSWGSDGAAFEAVPDAHVTGTDAGGVALSSKDGGTFATSQTDGTYALWDYAFTGGTTRIDAALGPESASATAFEVSDGPGIGVYNKVAHANITFPAVEPPPVPPQVEVQVVQESTGNLISGVVVSGTSLQIGFHSNTPETEYTIYGARVAGQELAVRQAQQGDRPGWTHVVAEPFTPANPGTYTVEAAAAPGVGSPVNTSTTFRVIAEGGSVETDPLSPPKVITARLYPKPNATGVPVTAFLNVAFTEPVRGIPGNVRLLAGETEIPIRISGVTPDGQVIEAISGDHEILTSLTIQPLAGLRYSTAYRLLLASGITDLDPEPKALEPFEVLFTTFGPASVGGTTDDRNGSAGIVVLGDRAYLTRTNALVNGNVVVFDITDPVEPAEVGVSEVFAPRPYDIVGEQADTGEKLIAVATGSTNRSKPASVLLFEASTSEVPQFVGASSLTSSAADGFTSRIAIHGGFVYSATVRKGIQGVEIQRAKNTWSGLDSNPNPDLARQKAKTKLNTDGEGFGQDAVVINLPIPLKSNATPYYLNDIKAADVAGQTLVAVVGEPGLILAQPLISGITYQGRPEREGTRLDWGYALALGRLQDRDVAVVVGRGTVASGATTLLVTLDVSNPQAPLVLGAVSLSAELGALVPVDLLLKDSTALVGVQNSTGDQGFVLLVNLSDLATPEVSGRLEGVAGRLALDENGLLYGSARLSTGGSSINGGVKTATLGYLALVEGTDPQRVVVGVGPRAAETFNLKYRVIPADYEVREAQIEYRLGSQTVAVAPATLEEGRGALPLPLGYTFPAQGTALPRLVINAGAADQLVGPPRRLDLAPFQVAFDYDDDQADAESVSADQSLIGVTATNDELYRRFAEATAEKPAQGREVLWRAIDPPAATLTPNTGTQDGIFTTFLDTATQAGTLRAVEATMSGLALGTTEAVPVVAGVAASVTLTSADGRTAAPADGKTEILLTLEARDQFGNPVEDGTAVFWETTADGEFFEAQEATTAGKATARYRVGGFLVRPSTIRAFVDDQVAEYALEQQVIEVEVEPELTELNLATAEMNVTARFSSASGPIADGAEVRFMSTFGFVKLTEPVQDGVARGRWYRGPDAWRPAVDVMASIGPFRASVRLPWRRVVAHRQTDDTRTAARWTAPKGYGDKLPPEDPSRPVATVLPSVIAGDKTENGALHVEYPDGSSEDLPYRAVARYEITGLTPGEAVSVRLGSTRNPNVLPLVAYSVEQGIVGTELPDDMGSLEGTIDGPVFVESDGFRGQSLRFAGEGEVVVEHDEAFLFSGGFMVQTAVRPPPGVDQVLIEKSDDFRLELVQESGDLKARFTVWTADGPEAITSLVPVPAGAWSLITGRYDGARLWVAVDKAEDFRALPAAPVHAETPIRIGAGFTGGLDEIRIFDLTRSYLSAFANGQQEIAFTADETGTFATTIHSSGVLAALQTAAIASPDFGRRLAFAMPLGSGLERFFLPFDEGGGTLSQQTVGRGFTDITTTLEDRAERSETTLGYVTHGLLAYAFRFIGGIWGASSEDDMVGLAGDLVGGTVLGIISTPKDFLNAAYNAIELQGNVWDAVAIAAGLIEAGAIVFSKKAALLKRGRKLLDLVQSGDGAAGAARHISRALIRRATDLSASLHLDALGRIADEGSAAAKAAVVGVIAKTDANPRALDALDNAVARADNADEVVQELHRVGDELSPAELKHYLGIVECIQRQLPASANFIGGGRPGVWAATRASVAAAAVLLLAAIGGDQVTCPVLTKKAIAGYEFVMKQAKAKNVARPDVYAAQLVGNLDRAAIARRVVPSELVQRVREDYMAKLADLVAASPSIKNLDEVVQDLAIGGRKAKGALFAVDFASSQRSLGKQIEAFGARELIPGMDPRNSRFYDIVLIESGRRVRVELKSWSLPLRSRGALDSAVWQLVRDFTLHYGPTRAQFPPDALRWAIADAPGAGPHLQDLRLMLSRIVQEDPRFAKALVNAFGPGVDPKKIEGAIAEFASRVSGNAFLRLQ